jgi:DNA repair protein RadA/Sms
MPLTSSQTKRSRTTFFCNECGHKSPKWEGRCPACDSWGTYAEAPQPTRAGRPDKGAGASRVRQALDEPASDNKPHAPRPLAEAVAQLTQIIPTGLPETDRVLGGGLVPGALILLAGDPGVGKSTLMLQASARLADAGASVLYASGEESAAQVGLRARRLGLDSNLVLFLAETEAERLIESLEAAAPGVVIVDSIQTLSTHGAPAAGSVGAVRESAQMLMAWAKVRGVPVVLAGHVTKDGAIAGPKVLEHMVDVVLQMEGDPVSSYRILRCAKNRFGATDEVALFEMRADGLAEVADPSAALVAERRAGVPGSAVVATLEGTRPLLAEVQALTSLAVAGPPRRTATGIDAGRMVMLTAVLTRRAGLRLGDQDVMVNVPGGLRIAEPASDLAVAMAIASSARDVPLDATTVCIGEVGLNGEVRRVPQLGRRLAEAARHGFSRALVPQGTAAETCPGMDIVPVGSVREAMQAAMGR